MKQYYYLNADVSKKQEFANLVTFSNDFNWHSLDDGAIFSSYTSLPPVNLIDGEFADILKGNYTLRIYSLKLKNIICEVIDQSDSPIWHPLYVFSTKYSIMQEYYILQFLNPPSVLDITNSTFLGNNQKLVVKAKYNEELIGKRHIFTYINSHINRTIISHYLRDKIYTNKCIGIYIYNVLGGGKLI